MKANYKSNYVPKSLIKEKVKEEFDRITDKVYDDVKKDVAAQLMAVCCCALHAHFGFGKQRLNKFKAEVEDYFSLMLEKGIFGKTFTPINCIDYMRDEFGIDFDKDVNIISEKDLKTRGVIR